MTITTLAELLKDSAYKLTQFKSSQIKTLEAGITMKESGKGAEINCCAYPFQRSPTGNKTLDPLRS